jgi:hypothetical protein
LDGDLNKVGIRVAGLLTVAARARDACVGVMMAEHRLDCERAMVGVDGIVLGAWSPREAGLAEEVSSVMFCRARLAGAVFSSRSVFGIMLLGLLSRSISSLSSNFTFDWERFKLGLAAVNRPS